MPFCTLTSQIYGFAYLKFFLRVAIRIIYAWEEGRPNASKFSKSERNSIATYDAFGDGRRWLAELFAIRSGKIARITSWCAQERQIVFQARRDLAWPWKNKFIRANFGFCSQKARLSTSLDRFRDSWKPNTCARPRSREAETRNLKIATKKFW